MKINRNVIELQALESAKPPRKRMHILRERFAEAARKMCAELLRKKRKPQTEDGVAECGNPFTQIARKICKSEKQISPRESNSK